MNKWYSIKNEALKDSAEVIIHGIVGDSSFDFFGESNSGKDIAREIRGITTSEIQVKISSDGGNVYDGLLVYNTLLDHKAKVNVIVQSHAFSIASVIAMAGDTVEMPASSSLMIHDPSVGVNGDAATHILAAEALGKMKSAITEAYVSRTGIPAAEISGMMAKETWFTAQEAVDAGFATKVTRTVKNEKPTNVLNFTNMGYKNVPKRFLNNIEKIKERGVLNMDLKEFKDAHGELYLEVFADGVNKGRKEGAVSAQPEVISKAIATETARVKEVEAQCLVGHEELVNLLKYDGKTTGAQAAMMVLKAEKAIAADIQAKLKADSGSAAKAEPENSAKKTEGVEKWTKDFENSADLKEEFKIIDTYLAYQNGVASGRIKSYKGGS